MTSFGLLMPEPAEPVAVGEPDWRAWNSKRNGSPGWSARPFTSWAPLSHHENSGGEIQLTGEEPDESALVADRGPGSERGVPSLEHIYFESRRISPSSSSRLAASIPPSAAPSTSTAGSTEHPLRPRVNGGAVALASVVVTRHPTGRAKPPPDRLGPPEPRCPTRACPRGGACARLAPFPLVGQAFIRTRVRRWVVAWLRSSSPTRSTPAGVG